MRGQSLGLQLKCGHTSRSLLVREVLDDGAIPEWNQDAPCEREVLANDHIVSVNGTSGDV